MNKTMINAAELTPLELYEVLRTSFDSLYIEEEQPVQTEHIVQERTTHFPLYWRHAALQK